MQDSRVNSFFRYGKDTPAPSMYIDIPVHKKGDGDLVVGHKWVKVKIDELITRIPMYDPFLEASGYYFDILEAKKIINFVIRECVFPEGPLTGLPFVLERWQLAVILNIFCWKEELTHRRRYREAFIYVPRKNGKTAAFGAIISLIMFFCNPEKRGQCFCAAADVDQASQNFRHVRFMVENNPRLISRLHNSKVYTSTRAMDHIDGTTFKVLSAIADTKHGLSPSFNYIDEVHAHKSSDLIDVLITGTGARPDPLTVYTTTADFDKPSVCNDLYKRAKQIARGQQSDPRFLPVIYEAERSDDWKDPAVHRKANPNYGVSKFSDYMERQVQVAIQNPSTLNRFLRLELNIRTTTETAFIAPYIWNRGGSSLPDNVLLSVKDLRGWLEEFPLWHNVVQDQIWNNDVAVDNAIHYYRRYLTWYFQCIEQLQYEECYGGYDGSSVLDLTAFSLFFPNRRIVLNWNWVPGETIYGRSKRDAIPYDIWYRAGVINNIPGEVINEESICETLIGSSEGEGILTYFKDVRCVAVDRWGSNYIQQKLTDNGIWVRRYPQSYAGMNQPIKKLEEMAIAGELRHGLNPALEHQNACMVVSQNSGEERRPNKEKSTDRIDGMVSILDALGGWIYPDDDVITTLQGFIGTTNV